MVDNLFLLKPSHAIIYIYIAVAQDIDCIPGGSLVELVSIIAVFLFRALFQCISKSKPVWKCIVAHLWYFVLFPFNR